MKPSIRFRAMGFDDVNEFIRRTSYCPTAQFGGIVAYHDGTIMGAIGFDNWTHTTVHAHWWIDQPRCIMPLWREANAYLSKYGKKKIIGATPSDNVRALRMIFGRLRFHELTRIKDGWCEGVDIVISEYIINEQELGAGAAGDAAATAAAVSAAGGAAGTERQEHASAA